jgi:hypothetical protein
MIWVAMGCLLVANVGLLLRLRRLERRVEANADRPFVAPPRPIEESRQFMNRLVEATTMEQVRFERLAALRRRLEDEHHAAQLAALRVQVYLTVRR